jgi:hypothetical protein
LSKVWENSLSKALTISIQLNIKHININNWNLLQTKWRRSHGKWSKVFVPLKFHYGSAEFPFLLHSRVGIVTLQNHGSWWIIWWFPCTTHLTRLDMFQGGIDLVQ